MAIRLRFWAMAASRNSSLAPVTPRNRRLTNDWMRFRWANSISTFLRSLRDCLYASVLATRRARSRASSCTLRAILRIGVLGQQRSFSGQPAQSWVLAR